MSIDYDDVERTELVWPGKRTEVDRVALPFQTVETLSEPRVEQRRLDTEDWPENYPENWKNRLIWGDNKYIMSSLLEEFVGEIDLMYIDPPFATGADFSIDIEIGENIEATKEPSVIEEHAYRDTWGKGLQSYLQMMYDRLVLMKDLLADHASIYVHLDWRVVHYLRAIMDEVFGSERFEREIIWRIGWVSGYKTQARNWIRNHDSILFYTMNDNFKFNKTYIPYEEGYTRRGDDKPPEGEGIPIEDVWNVHPEEGLHSIQIMSFSREKTGYTTQKSEALLHRVIEASSAPGDLVADFFCGSGTTGVVAEKLGRRWLMSDLSKYAIHTTRKRLLDIHNYSNDYDRPCRPFVVQNLGSYQKHKFIDNGHPPVEEYRSFILELYGAEAMEGYSFIHGRRGNRLVHIAGVDSIVTVREIDDAAQECRNAAGGRQLDVLGWDFELGLDQQLKDVESTYGIEISPKYIPREAAELRRAAEAGEHVRFYDMSYLEVDWEIDGRRLQIDLADFMLANPEYIPGEVREGIDNYTDYIDYWAVDFNYKDDTFHNGWQSFRTRQDRSLDRRCVHHYDSDGHRTVLVKVIDIFGNDTNRAFEVMIDEHSE